MAPQSKIGFMKPPITIDSKSRDGEIRTHCLMLVRDCAWITPIHPLNLGEISCDNLVTILHGNRPIWAHIGALTSGCNSLKMLVDVGKC
jgi:hypothetical protein